MFLFSLVFSMYIFFFQNWDFGKSVACARPTKKKNSIRQSVSNESRVLLFCCVV